MNSKGYEKMTENVVLLKLFPHFLGSFYFLPATDNYSASLYGLREIGASARVPANRKYPRSNVLY